MISNIASNNEIRYTAITHLKDVLTLDSNYNLAKYYIGKIYSSNEMEEFELALPYLRSARESFPDNLDVIWDLSRTVVAVGDKKLIEGTKVTHLNQRFFCFFSSEECFVYSIFSVFLIKLSNQVPKDNYSLAHTRFPTELHISS
jgi:tetratricopeptide (TPR) repeat protein